MEGRVLCERFVHKATTMGVECGASRVAGFFRLQLQITNKNLNIWDVGRLVGVTVFEEQELH